MIDQVGVEVLDLLLGQLDFLERRHDLVVGEEPLLLSLLNKSVKLFDVGERDVDREQMSLAFSCGDAGGSTSTPRRTGRASGPLRRARYYSALNRWPTLFPQSIKTLRARGNPWFPRRPPPCRRRLGFSCGRSRRSYCSFCCSFV